MSNDDWWEQAVDQFGLDADAVVFPTVPGIPVEDVTKPLPRRSRRRRHVGVDWLIIAVCALAAAFLLRAFVVQQFAVQGQSMLSTLHSGDRVIVNKLSYDVHDPRHGDIVVLKDIKESLAERDLIKRVIGLPGETVEYRDCELFIDGQRISEPYLDPVLVGPDHCGDSQAPVKVSTDHVFVMGDNRAASLDSRTVAIGQIPFGHLIGRAFLIVWPRSDWGWL
ncbi:MAG: signal peptidase [Ilumatobacteraceae bacterium]|jgi:signal peptidase I